MFAPAPWFIAQQSMHDFVSGCIAHAASPPPPLLDAPDEPPLEVPPDEVPPLLVPPLLLLVDPPLLLVDPPLELVEPPLLLVDPPDEDDDDDDDELPFLPPVGSVLLVPVPVPPLLPSSGFVGTGDAAHATSTAAMAVSGSARLTCLMGVLRSGEVLLVRRSGASKRRLRGPASRRIGGCSDSAHFHRGLTAPPKGSI